MKTQITPADRQDLINRIYDSLISNPENGLGEMGACRDEAERIVNDWLANISPIWSEIRDTFEDEGILHIDAWTTEDEEEDGRTIAKINLTTGEVEYLDERAKTDESAQETIQFHVDEIKKSLV
jgi:hypothetical protein